MKERKKIIDIICKSLEIDEPLFIRHMKEAKTFSYKAEQFFIRIANFRNVIYYKYICLNCGDIVELNKAYTKCEKCNSKDIIFHLSARYGRKKKK